MSAPAASGLSPRWADWYRRVLPAYWLFLAVVTHLPELSLGKRVPSSDKLAHVVSYGVLAFLFWRFGQAIGAVRSGRFVWIAAVLLALYAAVDEYTQGYVGRSPSLLDFAANLAGVGGALLLLEWHRRRRGTTQRAT